MCFLCCLTNRQAALRNDAVYHGTAAICISIELYEIVQLLSGDGVALTLTVGVVGLTLRGVRLLGRIFILKRKLNNNKIYLGKKFVERTVR